MKKLTHTTYVTAHLSASENTLQGELSSLFQNNKKNFNYLYKMHQVQTTGIGNKKV